MRDPASSPRRRGSAVGQRVVLHRLGVLPAQAGVSRTCGPRRRCRGGPPRAGGGQPAEHHAVHWSHMSSPRRRGSAADRRPGRPDEPVLPAQAGVSRPEKHRSFTTRGPPRAGGGQPASATSAGAGTTSSPRRRGSAGDLVALVVQDPVLPAQAGVSRKRGCPRPPATRPPRAGGGQPYHYVMSINLDGSSPRRRGSADLMSGLAFTCLVLPAQAGVSRPDEGAKLQRVSPPRAGGGQPSGDGPLR